MFIFLCFEDLTQSLFNTSDEICYLSNMNLSHCCIFGNFKGTIIVKNAIYWSKNVKYLDIYHCYMYTLYEIYIGICWPLSPLWTCEIIWSDCFAFGVQIMTYFVWLSDYVVSVWLYDYVVSVRLSDYVVLVSDFWGGVQHQ